LKLKPPDESPLVLGGWTIMFVSRREETVASSDQIAGSKRGWISRSIGWGLGLLLNRGLYELEIRSSAQGISNST
jgi:hypothetical protein